MFIDVANIETRAFINGAYVDSVNKGRIEKNSSLTNEQLVKITACDAEDVKKAIKFAKAAYDKGEWKNKKPAEKKEILLRLADLMEENIDYIARLDCYETSRAYKNYRYDSIPKAIEAMRYFAEAVDKVYDVAIPPRKDEFGMVMRQPLGVVGIITPWNDPMVVGTWKFVPALLMGNSVVIKPAEQSSLSMIFTASLALQAGVPAGVFNVVPGFGEVAGKELAINKDVNGIFFTGSSEVGKKLLAYVGDSDIKKVGLECGGKSPYIVTNKCGDIKKAAYTLAQNVFYNQGQICSAPSRAIVNDDVYDEFLEYLKEASERYCPGNSYNIENEVGCVVSKEQYDKVMKYIEVGKSEAKGVYSPENKKDLLDDACGINPVIFYDVDNQARIAREEIFGPVVTVIKYSDNEEAIRIANDTEYGLAGAVWTDDLKEAYYIASSIKAGLVHVNSYGEDDNSAPFGGVKNSGLGKDKSVYAFDEYSELKTVWVKTV